MDLMVDLETLGIRNDAIILTIGAQLFDPSVKGWETKPQKHIHTGNLYSPSINYRVDVDEQEAKGRSIDPQTLDWWTQQSKEAQDEAFSPENRIPFRQALLDLVRMAEPCNRVWAKGILFDFAILEHALAQEEIRLPWKFWKVMDARTVYALTPTLPQKTNGHQALEDCRNQISMLQDAFGILGVEQLK